MDTAAFLAVLAAAAMHAGWNTVVKIGGDRLVAMGLVAAGAGFGGAVLLPFFAWPVAESWPWLLSSVACHIVYSLSLAEAYHTGDLGQVYPLVRGTAPVLVAIITALLLPEDNVSAAAYVGIGILACGIVLIAFSGRGPAGIDRRALGFSLLTALAIAGYVMSDGLGGRASNAVHGYALWLFVLNAVALLPIIAFRRGRLLATALRRQAPVALAGGLMQLFAYWIVIWAMSVAPIPLVAALRETSILFVTVIALFVLRERVSPLRAFAALVIVAGVIVTRLG